MVKIFAGCSLLELTPGGMISCLLGYFIVISYLIFAAVQLIKQYKPTQEEIARHIVKASDDIRDWNMQFDQKYYDWVDPRKVEAAKYAEYY